MNKISTNYQAKGGARVPSIHQRPSLLFYCQHSLGMGHLIRSLALAETLSVRFRVVFLNGGKVPEAVPFPKDIERIDLPPLGMDSQSKLISLESNLDLNQVKRQRLHQIQTMFAKAKPEVVFIEMFPFGRKKFAYELLPLLKLAQASRPKPAIICSLRDILVNQRRDQQHYDDRAGWLVERYFDAVLVHTDPNLFRLEHSFRPRRPLRKPVFYTGFVLPNKSTEISVGVTNSGLPKKGIVISAGGGIVGGRLLRCAIHAYPLIQRHRPIPMTLIAGPFLPEEERRKLLEQSNHLPNLRVLRSVSNLTSILYRVDASISQCGYNTAMDVLRTGIKALFVPYSQHGENEQLRRSQALARLGISQHLPESRLSARRLAEATLQLLDFHPKPHHLNLDGAYGTCAIVSDLHRWAMQGSCCEYVA